jgi:hypothetical protein
MNRDFDRNKYRKNLKCSTLIYGTYSVMSHFTTVIR